jgi:RNA polymerase sigma factor (sigma-70 family)
LPEIEAAIDAAVGQDLQTLLDRAHIRDRKVENYIASESFVYLVRDACRNGSEEMRDNLLPLLLGRCAAILKSKIPETVSTAVQLREEILGDFAELFAKDGTSEDRHELDFYEVRFNQAFRAFRVTRFRAEINRLNKTKGLPDAARPKLQIDEEVLARLLDLNRSTADPEHLVLRKQLRAAIDNLPPEEREALVLCRLMGLKEESEDPNERTAATECGVTGRTIRNRVERALAKLSKMKEES